jgi:hypothetical protein
MTTVIATPSASGRWKIPALWLAPWVFYLSAVLMTLAAATVNGRGFGWLRPLEKNEVLRVLAGLVVVLWISARVSLAVKSKSAWLVVALATAELPFAFVVYLLWVFGMIGGPINPG